MDKIDFFGGLHGNFLELVINCFIYQLDFDLSTPQFLENGACHLKGKNQQYRPVIRCWHYTMYQTPFDNNDRVVRILLSNSTMLPGFVNSFLRGGNQVFDIDDLEIDTSNKLKQLPKAALFLKNLETNFGKRDSYPRSVLRNHFYSMFDVPEYGIDLYNKFTPGKYQCYEFSFDAFFNQGNFYSELNRTAQFLNLNFYPDSRLSTLYQEFLARNQGYHSQLKCQKILDAILNRESCKIKLNIIEEAWINFRIAEIFRCYDLPDLIQDQYPTDTRQIGELVYNWKSADY